MKIPRKSSTINISEIRWFCQFKKKQERWGNDNVKCTDRHSSPISSPNITRRWKFLEKISFPLFLQPIANDCERNFIKPQNKNRGFEPTATHAHLEISQRCKPGFLSRLSTPLCICASLPLPSPAISRIRPSVSFFREERRRIMGECSTRRCKRFFGTIASVFAAVFFLATLDRSYLLELSFIYDRDLNRFWCLIVQFLSYL